MKKYYAIFFQSDSVCGYQPASHESLDNLKRETQMYADLCKGDASLGKMIGKELTEIYSYSSKFKPIGIERQLEFKFKV